MAAGPVVPTILVVDDEPMIRELAKRTLKIEGYEVVVAVDGEDALRHMRDGVQLLVTDIEMPRRNGLELAAEARRRFPALPILFISAHGPEAIAMAGPFLPKPFLPEALVSRVEQLLSA